MAKFEVFIEETYSLAIVIDAESHIDAIPKVRKNYHKGEIDMSKAKLEDLQFKPELVEGRIGE